MKCMKNPWIEIQSLIKKYFIIQKHILTALITNKKFVLLFFSFWLKHAIIMMEDVKFTKESHNQLVFHQMGEK